MKRGENPLATNNQRANVDDFSDNMSYNTPDKRQFLSTQIKSELAKIFSRKKVSFQGLEFKEFIPKSFMNVYDIKYDKLRNVNGNGNVPGRTMTYAQMKQDAAEDINKIKAYVSKAYEKMTPVVKGEYGILGLDFEKNQVIKSIPTASELAKGRFKKASMVNAVQKQNPVMKAVSKAVIKNPRGGVDNGVVSRFTEYEKLVKRDKALGGSLNKNDNVHRWGTLNRKL